MSSVKLTVVLSVVVMASAIPARTQVLIEARSEIGGVVVGERDYVTFHPREFVKKFTPSMLDDSSETNIDLGIRVAYHLDEGCDLLFAIQDSIKVHYADDIKGVIRDCEGDTIMVRQGDTLVTIVSRYVVAEWRYLFCSRLRERHSTSLIPVSGEAVFPVRLIECHRVAEPMWKRMRSVQDEK